MAGSRVTNMEKANGIVLCFGDTTPTGFSDNLGGQEKGKEKS